jgi:hypothetical protein
LINQAGKLTPSAPRHSRSVRPKFALLFCLLLQSVCFLGASCKDHPAEHSASAAAVSAANSASATASSATATASSGKGGMVKNVIVARQNSEYLGNMTLYLSDRACRFEARNDDIVIASHAPDWQIILYSHKKNKGYVYAPKRGGDDKLDLFPTFFSLSTGKATSGYDKNLKIDYVEIYKAAGPKMDACNDAFIFQNRTRRPLRDQTLRVAKVGTLPPEVSVFVNFIYSTGTFPGVPLDHVTRYKDGTANVKYHTFSIGHTQKPASFFAYPTGYTKVADKIEVLLADDTKTTLEDLFAPPAEKSK